MRIGSSLAVALALALAGAQAACASSPTAPASLPEKSDASSVAQPFLVPAAGVCLPAKVGPLVLTRQHVWAADNVGVSLLDEATLTLVTLYVYAVGSESFSEHFGSVVEEMLRANDASQANTGTLTDRRFMEPGRLAIAAHSRRGMEVVDQVVVFRHQGFYYKARATFPMELRDEAQQLVIRAIHQSFNPCDSGRILGGDGRQSL